jgi:hypothetical protein
MTMDKTLKKRIAREWLILLGAIGVGLLVFMSLYIVSYYVRDYKEYQKQLAQWHEDHPNPAKECEKKLSEWKKNKPNDTFLGHSIYKTNEEQEKANPELKWIMRPKFVPDPPTPVQYPPIEFSDYSIWLIVILPYIIVQFIRSIIWAIKQVY